MCRGRRLTKGLFAGASYADTFGKGLDAAFGLMSAFLFLALTAADEDAGLSHLATVPATVRLHPLACHTTYAWYVGGVLHAEAVAHVAHWEQTVARLEGGAGASVDRAPEAPGAALLAAVELRGDSRLQAGIKLLPASAQRQVMAEHEKAKAVAHGASERHNAEFVFSSPSAARRAQQWRNP